jgi:DNA-binding MarR family transcriptional regulator
MASDKLAPGKQKILDTLGEAEQRPNATQGFTFGDLLERTGLDRSILSQYLKNLQDGELIKRTTDRRYLILDQGRQALATRDDIFVISRNTEILHEQIVPDVRVGVPKILPTEVKVYGGPDIKRLIESRAVGADKKEAKYSVLAEMAAPITAHLERIFVNRFTALAQDWSDYYLQQMQRTERRRYLQKRYSWQLPNREERDRTLDHLESLYMRRKWPEGGPPPLTLDTILDFEALVLVKVSREKIAKDRERIRCGLAAHLLGCFLRKDSPLDLSFVAPMVQSGIITTDDLQEYKQAKDHKRRLRILRELKTKYDKLAKAPYAGLPKIITAYAADTI